MKPKKPIKRSVLDMAEELIMNLDPDEKNKQLCTLYRFIHSHNKSNSCFKVHEDWRNEFASFTKPKE